MKLTKAGLQSDASTSGRMPEVEGGRSTRLAVQPHARPEVADNTSHVLISSAIFPADRIATNHNGTTGDDAQPLCPDGASKRPGVAASLSTCCRIQPERPSHTVRNMVLSVPQFANGRWGTSAHSGQSPGRRWQPQASHGRLPAPRRVLMWGQGLTWPSIGGIFPSSRVPP